MSDKRKPIPNLDPIFEACCDPEAVRYDLSTPFIRDGYVAATDGRIMVRQKTGSKRQDKGTPNANTIFSLTAYESEPLALVLPSNLRRHDDEGSVLLRDEPYEFSLKAKYIRLLLRHGVEEVFLPVLDEDSSITYACRFVKGEIEGLLMPAWRKDGSNV